MLLDGKHHHGWLERQCDERRRGESYDRTRNPVVGRRNADGAGRIAPNLLIHLAGYWHGWFLLDTDECVFTLACRRWHRVSQRASPQKRAGQYGTTVRYRAPMREKPYFSAGTITNVITHHGKTI